MKFNFASLFQKTKSHPPRVPRTVVGWWSIELGIAALLLIIVLGFDIWIYRSLVARRPEISRDQLGGVTTLDRKAIEKASKGITAHESLLQNPDLPSIQNPF